MEGTNVIHLKEPDELSLENAYRSLPKTGEIALDTTIETIPVFLEMLERTGFAGMKISSFTSLEERILIKACKGKQGNCYNTGRTARYVGEALAALDDDHHLLFKGLDLPVCEKTANLYSMPPYRDHIQCTTGDDELLDKFHNEPESFDYDTLEQSLEKLYTITRNNELSEEFTDLFYPGPFRILILDEGTIIHRGRVNKVPVQVVKKLSRSDGLFSVAGMEAGTPASFPDLYRLEGPLCLLKKSRGTYISLATQEPDFSSLDTISRELRTRILNTLEGRKDYFMLTGSNREDQFGCCPSDEVTGADKLVGAGILSANRESEAPDACPLTIYTFQNEISDVDGKLHFSQNQSLRQQVHSRLKKPPMGILKIIARWALLVFVALTITLAIIRLSGPSTSYLDNELYERLDVSRPNGMALVLFHYTKRCDQCLAMEKFARDVLKDEFPEMINRNQIHFRQIKMDLPENRKLLERFGIITSTLVIIRFEEMREDSILVLDRSWALYDNETEFKQMLSEELQKMVEAER
jgi:hypothetical protein